MGGTYTATLTQYQGNNTIVQFYVEATSEGGQSMQPSQGVRRPGLWVVDNSSIPRDLRIQRFVISEQSLSALGNSGDSGTFDYAFPRLSNHYFNTTFISNENRIIYNCEIRKSGSPFTRSSSANLSRAKWKTPGDRRFRGYSRRSIDNDAGGGRAYHNRIIRYWLYLFGHAASENEFVRVIINGGEASLREDVEPNSNDFLKRNWEDGHLGELYRIDDEWWFQDNWSRDNRNADWSYKDTEEPERYHAEWIKRSRETEYDYSSLVAWMKAVGEDDFTREEIERMADIDMMAANAVVRGWCDDWDTLTRNRGKNGYFLRRATDNRWMLVQWDSDLTFGNANAEFIGNLPGVRNFFRKPYVEQRVHYYLGQMIEKYTHNSPRLAAWFKCEEEASGSYGNNVGTYTSWNANRLNRARSEIGSTALNAEFDVITGNGSSVSTSAETISLNGESPHDAFRLRVVGHPEAEWSFLSPTTWTLSGIGLAEGDNVLVVQALDADGHVVGEESFTVRKTGNAVPVVDVEAKPSSFQLALQNTLELDVTESFDPEGTDLTYLWSVGPEEGVRMEAISDTVREASFTRSGWYVFDVAATDAAGRSTTASREAAVFALNDWTSFSESVLEEPWEPENLSLRDGAYTSAWYSLNDRPGKLTIKVEPGVARPLKVTNASHPILWRPLPAETDWSLHSDVELVSVQQGEFMAGILVEVEEMGAIKRYAFGMENGGALRLRRVTGGGSIQLASQAWGDKHAVIRIRRQGSELNFEYRTAPGEWVHFSSDTLNEDAEVQRGGLFTATEMPQAVRVEFDYVFVVDPEAVSPAVTDLRISEIMYHPEDGAGPEFLELHNRGESVLELEGLHFEATRPFGAYVFGDLTLAPGEYAVLVADLEAFQAVYDTGEDAPRVLGQWQGGSLDNGGERIVLRDAFGNRVLDLTFDDSEPWPQAADGSGFSLEIQDVHGDFEDPLNWVVGGSKGGTPGRAFDPTPPEPSPDSDGDGLTDAEELALGTMPGVVDTDGDGQGDGSEVEAGTDPLDRQSLFEVLSVARDPDSGRVTTTWSSVPGKTYVLQASDRLEDANWVDLGEATASGASLSLVEEFVPEDSRRFYRVVLLSQE